VLIGDFLSVSKLETGTFAASTEQLNLEEYLAGIADEFTQTLEEKQITLNTVCNPPAYTYTSDSRLFHIITSNLLSNAVKYTPAGGVIDWGYQVTEQALIFTIADSGIGIPVPEQNQLFNKFFRATNAQKHQTEGTGLGLYIVQQSAEQLGGKIEFVSSEDAGTAFTVTLPLT
jgi:signal transduction histidine kinase